MGVLVFEHIIMRAYVYLSMSLASDGSLILSMRSTTPRSLYITIYIYYIRTNPLWFCMEAVERMNNIYAYMLLLLSQF